MNIGLWIGQALLAGVFLFSAITKGFWSKEKLIAKGQTGWRPCRIPHWRRQRRFRRRVAHIRAIADAE